MAKTDPTIINERLEKALMDARKSMGLTQIDVSKRLKKPQSFVSKYETGERKLTVGDFVAVCEVLGIEPGKIINKVS